MTDHDDVDQLLLIILSSVSSKSAAVRDVTPRSPCIAIAAQLPYRLRFRQQCFSHVSGRFPAIIYEALTGSGNPTLRTRCIGIIGRRWRVNLTNVAMNGTPSDRMQRRSCEEHSVDANCCAQD